MKPVIILDSTPLGLVVQRRDHANAEKCRQWLKGVIANGARIIVPEIVNYELRRELLRLGKNGAIAQLAAFNKLVPGRYLPITTAAMDLAAQLWADVRRKGKPTADSHALDIDVILAAQVLSAGLNPSEFVVATSNVSHLSLFVPAEPWEAI
jgi:predicted nucleic acid-binding protein